MTISFDQDVILNFGGDTGSWKITKSGTGEKMRITSSGAGAPVDEGRNTTDFANIEKLAAGETLALTTFHNDPDKNSIVGLGALSVFTASTAIPEPSSTALLGLGGLALIFRRRR